MALLKKNDVIRAEIQGMTAEGSGVARYEGMAVFVPGSAEGDVAELTIIKVTGSYAIGKIKALIKQGGGRCEPDCPSYPRCGGCTFRHLDYREECRVKLQRVNDAIKRIGGVELEAEEFIAADSPDRYRNKAQIPFGSDKGQAVFGFYAERSHRIIPFHDCLLQPGIFGSIAQAAANFLNDTPNDIYDETTGKGRFRHLYIRRGFATGEIMVCAVVNANGLVREDEFVRRIRADTIHDVLCGVTFEISPLSFYQVNREQAERLYLKAAEYANLDGSQVIYDLYCGTGTIGLTMASKARTVYGIEIIPDAVRNAVRNAEINGISNAHFICADAYDGAKQLLSENKAPDVVIVDPPRKGCSEAAVSLINQISPERIVYISCDPATLARDVSRLRAVGWQLEKFTAVDMFPRTANVETVALLSKKK